MTNDDRYRWMERLLDELFQRYSDDEVRSIMRDESAREQVIDALRDDVVGWGGSPELLRSSTGRSLVLGVMALRAKFPIEDARAKVQLNIKMRERG